MICGTIRIYDHEDCLLGEPIYYTKRERDKVIEKIEKHIGENLDQIIERNR